MYLDSCVITPCTASDKDPSCCLKLGSFLMRCLSFLLVLSYRWPHGKAEDWGSYGLRIFVRNNNSDWGQLNRQLQPLITEKAPNLSEPSRLEPSDQDEHVTWAQHKHTQCVRITHLLGDLGMLPPWKLYSFWCRFQPQIQFFQSYSILASSLVPRPHPALPVNARDTEGDPRWGWFWVWDHD